MASSLKSFIYILLFMFGVSIVIQNETRNLKTHMTSMSLLEAIWLPTFQDTNLNHKYTR